MSAYTQRQLEQLDVFVQRKKTSKEMRLKQFMQGFCQESYSSIVALVMCAIPVVLIIILVTSIFIISSCTKAHADEIPESLAVRAIVGEGAGEGLEGMRCLASAIRNRGTLKGVYGLHAKHIKKEPKWVFEQARKAWKESAKIDFVCKASFWEGKSFSKPYWAKNMIFVKSEGNQNFYRQKGKI